MTSEPPTAARRCAPSRMRRCVLCNSYAIQLLKPLTRRVHLQRAELRAERLQHRLDESLDANKTLRSQLSESSASLTHAMQQLRKFQGTTDKAAARKHRGSVPQLQRTIDGLRERLARGRRTPRARHRPSTRRSPPLVAERQRLLAAHEERQKACPRKDHELRRARPLLRESGEAKGGALSEVSHLELARGREQQKFGRELYALTAQLELERNRAAAAEARAARAARAASAGATRSRSAHRLAAGRPGTAAAGEDEEAAAAAAAADEGAAAERRRRAALPPSAQVRAAMSAAVAEEARRRAAAEARWRRRRRRRRR